MKITFVLRNKKNQLKVSTKTVERFIERIKTDTKEAAVAHRRRLLHRAGYIESYDSQFPSHMVYPCAQFEKDANDNLRMKLFNGMVALVVDNLEHPSDVESVKQAAQILHYTLAAFVGPSEREVIILVRIATPEGSPATEEEADSYCMAGYKLAAALYQAVLPKPVSWGTSSVRTNFHMPLDARPYLNLRAIALPVSEKPMQVVEQQSQIPVIVPTSEEVEEKVSGISQETRRLMDYLNSHYQFRYNTTMGYTEYKDNVYKYMVWTPVDDRVLKGLTMKVRLAGIEANDNDVRRYVQSDMIRPYNPVSDYLWEQYGKWDGTDHIRRLARTIPTNNPHWENWFYTWFLGMVRQWQVANFAKYGNQAVPLLISAQGWNKTTFCEQLLPPELSWGYTGNLQMNDKRQVLQQMAQMLLINLDEFNQISPQIQQGFLKNIITLSSVKIKRPYGRHVEDFPRRASFIATTNQPDVLADPSGSRRFLGVELTGPIDMSTPPNHEQLYAQAMQALHRHELYYFDAEATRQIMESNRRFSVKTPVEEFFFDYFEPAADENEGQWMSATAILHFLKDEIGISLLRPVSVIKFGRLLSGIPNLPKRLTRANSEYLVKHKSTTHHTSATTLKDL